MIDPKAYYTVDDVAQLLGLHVRTVRRFIRDGKLSARRVGKQYRIADRDLEALVGTRTEGAVAPRQRQLLASTTVDIDEIDRAEQERFVAVLLGAFASPSEAPSGRRVDAIYFEDQRRLRVVVHADVSLTNAVLGMIGAILDDGSRTR